MKLSGRWWLAVVGGLGLTFGGCGGGHGASSSTSPPSRTTTATATSTSASTSSATVTLPGTGRPAITIGDKNFTEQFVLGELYKQALAAQGFEVSLNRNIGPTEVTIPALESSRIDVYPEYLSTWIGTVAGVSRHFRSEPGAFDAGQLYAASHGLNLLHPTPFADTAAIAVTDGYARANRLHTLADLRRVGGTLALGAPPQFQQDPAGLPALQLSYGFSPIAFVPLEVGAGYPALDQGKVQAAVVNTTDGQLVDRRYRLLGDPRRVFGWGNVVPVVSQRALDAEGPAFAETINRVDARLTMRVIRRLNAAVDIRGQTPAAAAAAFLRERGLLVPLPG